MRSRKRFTHRWAIGFAPVGALACVLAAAAASSCDRSSGLDTRVDTLASGRVVVSNPDLAEVGEGKYLELVEEMRIGAAVGTDDDAPEVFGNVLTLAVDQDGNTYVGDDQWNEVRVFDREGRFVRTIGAPGEGPGEFRRLAGITWDPARRVLWAVDIRALHFSAFDASGRFLGNSPHGRDTYSFSLPWVGFFDFDGFMYHVQPRNFDLLLKSSTSPDGRLTAVDSVALPAMPMGDEFTRSTGFGTVTQPVPMQPMRAWTVGPDGGVWAATTSHFRIHKVDFAGDTIRTVELRRTARRLTERERDSIAAANRLRTSRIPRTRPIIRRPRVGPDSWLWVAVEDDSTWEVFDDFGYHVGQAKSPVPLDSRPHVALGAGTITGVTRDDMGVQYVVRLRLQPR